VWIWKKLSEIVRPIRGSSRGQAAYQLMKKVIKILLIFVAGFLIFFGLVGVIMELTSENTELFGIILGVVFILIGGSLLNMGIRGGKNEPSGTTETSGIPEEQDPADTATGVEHRMETETSSAVPAAVEDPAILEPGSDESPHSFWQRKALIISSWIELVFFALGIVFALFFGVAGFVAGEMGAMLGILMVTALIGIAMIVSVRIVALWGLVKEKSWAPILNLIVSALGTVLLIFSGAWPAIVYTAFTGWCSVYLIRHKA
jgi:hypothetical protein